MTGKRAIQTTDCKITSNTVQIKILEVKGKQMTIAVFKQLITEEIVDYSSGKLMGEVWGFVNRHDDYQSHYVLAPYQSHYVLAPHLHIIWQKGNELRKDRIEMPPDWDRILRRVSSERFGFMKEGDESLEALANQIFLSLVNLHEKARDLGQLFIAV